MIRDVIANFDGSLNGSPFRVRPCDLNEEIPFPVALQEDASLEGMCLFRSEGVNPRNN